MATKCYKLTTQNNFTMKKTLWGENVSHSVSGKGELCSAAGWLHAYSHPLLAVLLNPIHANIKNPKLWEAYGSGLKKSDHGLKLGFTKLTTKKEIALPVITDTQKIAFAILCALEVCKEPRFVTWANNWLSGKDRTADAAAYAAYDAAYAAYAAYAAKNAAKAAENARYAAKDYYNVYIATAANNVNNDIDLIKLAKKAMKY